MSFFKDFKEDLSQAVNELLPGEELTGSTLPKQPDLVVNTLEQEVDVESELKKLEGLFEKVEEPVQPPKPAQSAKPAILTPEEPELPEIKLEDAEAIVKQGIKYVVEVSNMPCTNDAIAYLQKNGVVMAPSKAVNAGGVAVSALEMSQNSQRLSWTAEEVDKRLFDIMKDIHDNAASAAEEYGLGYNLMAGANLAGFRKVARAMYQQGVM